MSDNDEPRTITVHAKWETTVEIEVEDGTVLPDDWSNLSDWPAEILEQVTTETASLVDWDVTT